jgi:hypothetical protein
VVRADTADALRRAEFRLLELTDDCWSGTRRVGARTATGSEYEQQIGPSASITLHFGEVSDCEPWVAVDTTWPGEFDRVHHGDGYVQVFTFERPAEEKARAALESAAGLTKAIERLKRGEEVSAMLSDDDQALVRRAPAATDRVPLDGADVEFRVVRALGCTAAAAHFDDRTVTVWGRYELATIRLQTVADCQPRRRVAGRSVPARGLK